MFTDRLDAGMQLSLKLAEYKNKDGIVLAIPRGGVPVGFVVARELGLPMEILLSKKIGHPNNPEFAIGSVSMQGIVINDEALDVSKDYINKETERIQKGLKEKFKLFMGDQKPTDLTGKIVIIIDDGVATGNTILATIKTIKNSSPAKIIVAVPVAPKDSILKLKKSADEVISILTPNIFYGVGQFYYDFSQVSDEEALEYLNSLKKQAV